MQMLRTWGCIHVVQARQFTWSQGGPLTDFCMIKQCVSFNIRLPPNVYTTVRICLTICLICLPKKLSISSRRWQITTENRVMRGTTYSNCKMTARAWWWRKRRLILVMDSTDRSRSNSAQESGKFILHCFSGSTHRRLGVFFQDQSCTNIIKMFNLKVIILTEGM